MSDPAKALKELNKEKEFLIGIDSDGCAFDTMEIKHKECFIPNIIDVWNLQAVSRFAREVAEFVNLYSKSRGLNRFPALVETLELLAEREEAKNRGFEKPNVDSLIKWIEEESRLGNPALAEAVNKTNDPILAQALKWSENVNAAIDHLVRNVPPFPYVVDSLEKMKDLADLIVVSSTPCAALEKEWNDNDVAKYMKVIAGQEMGTKENVFKFVKEGRYEGNQILMIGDAPGDYRAAKANGALFYPINPGDEVASWKRFLDEALDKFTNYEYAGSYQDKLLKEFNEYLPATPPWER